MFLHASSIAVFLLAAFLSVCLAADTYSFTTEFGRFTLQVEQGTKDLGKTWFGRIDLEEKHRSNPTVKICERYAAAIYAKIAQTGDILATGRNTKKKDAGLFGMRGSPEVLVSVYTYKNSPYLWVSTLPRGVGQVKAKERINGVPGTTQKSAFILKSKLNKAGANSYYGALPDDVDSQIHAEEAAFALFETNPPMGLDLAGRQTYPAGSVVGTWHRGESTKRDKALVGELKPACSGDTGKNNVPCSVVTRALGVRARIEGEPFSEEEGTKRPASSDGNTNDPKHPKYDASIGSSKCHRALEDDADADSMGAACPLPNRKTSALHKGSQHTRTNLHARPTSSRKKGAAHPTTLKTMRATATGARNLKSKPTSVAAARQRPTKTRQGRPTKTTRRATVKTGKSRTSYANGSED